ncbi:lycopene cyclase domain-containing protein [Agromyces sp. NPDC056523]|uniref:lycopene cyclase domain-containing protein n=1 Tax=Agromyces sp. NPDC056523 TaxID=3345850 RepID=UPI0036734172
MTGFAYLGGLLVAIACMALIDARWRLAFWRAPIAAAVTIVSGVVYFLAWDAAGILLGVFFRGRSEIVTGIELAPELPLEEPVFLAFLCYLTLVLVLGVEQMLRARAVRADEASGSTTVAPREEEQRRP